MIETARSHEDKLDRFAGCLLGGAVGDALGAPVEFLLDVQIRKQFGRAGIQDFVPAYGRIGAFTDDTQMTLFTAEGLLRTLAQQIERGTCDLPVVMHRAYLRWLVTQGVKTPDPYEIHDNDGWLIGVPDLHARRAPGNSCLSALQSGRLGKIGSPINDSKGCGGVMRVAPVGLMESSDPEQAFRRGCEVAAITHGHPSGYIAAGFLAALIAFVMAGETLSAATEECQHLAKTWDRHDEVVTNVQTALDLAQSGHDDANLPILGEGWIAEEALAISLYCCLVSKSFEDAVILAVNHSGDSDSTGAITGNILGASWGMAAIPPRWLESVEMHDEILQLARDMILLLAAEDPQALCAEMRDRYPPN